MDYNQMMRVPNGADFNRTRVTNPNQSEVIRQRLYDFLLYPAAGAMELNFFSLPIGQGIATAPGAAVGSSKTKADTNLTNANMLPSGLKFQMESIEVVFFPGTSAAANTFLPAYNVPVGITESVIPTSAAQDQQAIANSGVLELTVLQKIYLQEPLMRSFPPKANLELDAALATATVSADLVAANNRSVGRPYYIDPMITLDPATNFGIKLSWPGLLPLPSTFNGRIGVILDGYTMRASQ